MSEPSELTAAKRALVDRYLRGHLPRASSSPEARLDQDESHQARQPAIAIQPGGSLTPIFFLHGQWETGGFFCFHIARALGPDRPFWALEPYRFEATTVPPPFDAIAAAHLESLRAVAPEGPYILAGWCNGALLAYEMARQLVADRQQIDRLVLIDPVYLRYPAHLRLIRSTISMVGERAGVAEDRQLAFYLWLRQKYRHIQHVRAYLRSADYRRTTDFTRFQRDDYPGIYDWTAIRYRPLRRYGGKVTFIWSSTQPFRRGWHSVEEAHQSEIHVLSCRHTTCLNEYLDEVIDCVYASLVGRG